MTTTTSNSVIEKIKKTLALAENNTNEHESRAAMLHAQRLLAKHGLSMKDVSTADVPSKKDVVENKTEASQKVWWTGRLASIVAENFKCFIYNSFYGRSHSIVFVGIKEDAEIAKTVFQFAKTSVEYYAKKYVNKKKKELEESSGFNFKKMSDDEVSDLAYSVLGAQKIIQLKDKYLEEKTYKMRLIMAIKEKLGLNVDAAALKNDFIMGFLSGLKQQFEDQVEKNDWGLVLVKDEDVVKYMDTLNLSSSKARSSAKRSGDQEAIAAGYKKGKSFSSPKGHLE